MNKHLKLAFGGGFGTGSLPAANYSSELGKQVAISPKRVYSVGEIDGMAIATGNSPDGIFDVSLLSSVAEDAANALKRNMERILFGDGSGKLYTGNASNSNVTGAGTDGDPYIIDMDGDATSIIESNFEEGDLLNVNAETTTLSVKLVQFTAGSELLHLVGTSARLATLAGANPFTTTDVLYMQGSKDNDPLGLKIIQKTTGSSYGVSHTLRRFQGFVKACAGAPISEDLLNELVMEIERRCKQSPDMLVASSFQVRKLKNILEDKKRVMLEPRSEKLRGLVSYSALAFDSANGLIPIIASDFVDKDYFWAINTSKIEMLHAPGWGWLHNDVDPGIFKQRDTTDRYQARYGGYMEIFIQPNFHGVLTGLADS